MAVCLVDGTWSPLTVTQRHTFERIKYGTGLYCASASNAADTLTRRQKDEIISTLPVPGARGVGRALEVSDLAADRANRHDSLAVSLGR